MVYHAGRFAGQQQAPGLGSGPLLFLELQKMIRTHLYVDGFNLFGGCLKKSPPGYRWLDIKLLAENTLSKSYDNVIEAVNYYTAIIRADGNGDTSPDRQKLYIKALEAHVPGFNVYYGSFTKHRARAKPVDQTLGELVDYWKYEEKGSDVNLASHLVADAFLDRYDCAVVISNDGDLAEAINMVTTHTNKTVGVIFPLDHPDPQRHKRRASNELVKVCDFKRELRPPTIRRSQMPDLIPGTRLHKPDHW